MTTLELIKKELKELSPVLIELELPTINYTFNSENDNSIAYCHALVYRRWLVVTDV
jgi:hypothetical protein